MYLLYPWCSFIIDGNIFFLEVIITDTTIAWLEIIWLFTSVNFIIVNMLWAEVVDCSQNETVKPPFKVSFVTAALDTKSKEIVNLEILTV